MTKVRSLDSAFWDDTVIDALPRDERLLAVALITLLADDEGRFVAEATFLKKRVFGLDKDVKPARVEEMLKHMASAWPNMRLYQSNGQLYGILLKFPEKQGIRYVVKSKLPPYDKSLDINDCGKLPEISPNSPRVGLGSIEKGRVEQRAMRVPVPFEVTPQMREWAAQEFPQIDIEKLTPAFVDYWKGVPGQKGLKLDWPATWMNDVRACADRGKFARKNAFTPSVELSEIAKQLGERKS